MFTFSTTTATSLLARSCSANITRAGGRLRLPLSPTPPSWYQKNALMYGEYPASTTLDDDADQPTLRTSMAPRKQTNTVDKKLYSMILKKMVRVKVSPVALREIDRKGGLDEYILLTSDEDLGGEHSVGVRLKALLKEKLVQEFPENANANDAEQKQDFDWRAALNHDFWDHLEVSSSGSSSTKAGDADDTTPDQQQQHQHQ